MKTTSTMSAKGSIAIGGGLLLGLGAGFFLLTISALYFVGSIIGGLGFGLLVSSFISNKQTLES